MNLIRLVCTTLLFLGCSKTVEPVLPAGQPSARTEQAMVYDAAHQQVLMFGGDANGTAPGELWAWDGSAWTQLSPSGGPPIKHAAGGWDTARGRLVIHRGYSGSAPQRDTWEWDGTTWTNLGAGPSVDTPVPIASSGTNNILMLDGNPANATSGATWHWNGTAWNKLAIAGPTRRFANTAAYDAAHNQMVIFGGQSTTGAVLTLLDDTWIYDGTTWTQK